MTPPKTKRNLFEQIFVDPPHEPDTREWDSLTPEEQDAIRMEARGKFVKGEPHRKLSPFTQAGKSVAEAIGSLTYKKKRPLAPPTQTNEWNKFMDAQAAKRAAQPRMFDRIASFPTDPPVPTSDTVDAQILMDLSKARREGDEAKQQTLREIWESRKQKEPR